MEDMEVVHLQAAGAAGFKGRIEIGEGVGVCQGSGLPLRVRAGEGLAGSPWRRRRRVHLAFPIRRREGRPQKKIASIQGGECHPADTPQKRFL
jgi:hypothetical protein